MKLKIYKHLLLSQEILTDGEPTEKGLAYAARAIKKALKEHNKNYKKTKRANKAYHKLMK